MPCFTENMAYGPHIGTHYALYLLIRVINNPLSNFDLSTMILQHIIEHPCDPDSPDFDLS